MPERVTPLWLSGVRPLPAYWVGEAPPFRRPVDALVVHSGAIGEGVAEYLATCRERKVSAHFAWSKGQQALVQMLPLDSEGWHAGGSTILGERANGRSIGIELSGPWHQNPRRDVEREAFRAVVDELISVLPLAYWTTHAAIQRTKRDPGPGFNAGWLDGFGLEWVGRL